MTWSDDPVRDAERWSAAGDEWTFKYRRANARCCECDRLIVASECYVLDATDKMGSAICKKCAESAVKILELAGFFNMSQVLDNELWMSKMDTPNEYDMIAEMEET